MRLRADQLAASLKRSGLAPLYLISGDEPLQIMECVDAIRAFARSHQFEERIVFDAATGFEWNTLLETGASLSLFSAKRLLELRLGKKSPGVEGGRVLMAYAKRPSPDDVLVITAEKIDYRSQQSQWYKAIDAAGITVQVRPIGPDRLPDWISRRVQKRGKRISGEAARLIADRTEGNLLAASQEIERLCLLIDREEIDVDEVLSAVTDNARYDVFALIENALSGDVKRTVHMLQGLREEGTDPMAIYGALMWEFRRLCSIAIQAQNGVPLDRLPGGLRIRDESRRKAVANTLRQHGVDELFALLRDAVRIERMIKSADRAIVWDAFQSLLLELAGHRLGPPALA